MTRYHVGSDGSPKPCNAQPGNCPLGGAHFDSEEKTIKFAERMNEITAEKEETEEELASLLDASDEVAIDNPAYKKIFERVVEIHHDLKWLKDREVIAAIGAKYDTGVARYKSPNVLRNSAHLRAHIMRGPDQQKAGLRDDGSVSNLYIYPERREEEEEEKLDPLRVTHFDMTENMYIAEDGQKFPMSATYDAETNELHTPNYGYAYGYAEAHAIVKEEEPPPPRVHNGDRVELFSQDEEGAEGFVKYIRRRMENESRETLDINGEECFFPKTGDEALKETRSWLHTVHRTNQREY